MSSAAGRSTAVGEAAVAVDESRRSEDLEDTLWRVGEAVAVDLADLDRAGAIGLDERDERLGPRRVDERLGKEHEVMSPSIEPHQRTAGAQHHE